MREILFKAKRKDNNEWVYGYIIKSVTTDKYFIATDEDTTKDYWNSKPLPEVIPETICQYTGLKDKNSVEIYENDIIKYKYNGEDGKKNEYIPKTGVMNFKKNGWHINSKWLDGFTMNMFEFEVIGNIFDSEVGNNE